MATSLQVKGVERTTCEIWKHYCGMLSGQRLAEETRAITREADQNGHASPLNSIEEWQEVLDQIIWTFEHINDNISPIYSDDYDFRVAVTEKDGLKTIRPLNKGAAVDLTPLNEHNKKIDKGLELFAKYYRSLWD